MLRRRYQQQELINYTTPGTKEHQVDDEEDKCDHAHVVVVLPAWLQVPLSVYFVNIFLTIYRTYIEYKHVPGGDGVGRSKGGGRSTPN